jgi:hypothetical protein
MEGSVQELQFDEAALDKAPADMNAEERHHAALCAFYELERQKVALEASADYLAELCGVTEAELDQVAAQARRDEKAEFGEVEEGGEQPSPEQPDEGGEGEG